MALRCKEGDIAVILGGPHKGFIVYVKRYLGNDRIRHVQTGEIRIGTGMWYVTGVRAITGAKLAVRDKRLQPIRPPKVAKTTETKQEIEA